MQLNEAQAQLREQILALVRRNLFAPPERAELEALGQVGPVVQLLRDEGALIQAGDLVFAREAVEEAVARLARHFQDQAQLTLAQFRDYLGTSRKYALPLLEYLDGAGYTRRRGDVRIPGAKLRG